MTRVRLIGSIKNDFIESFAQILHESVKESEKVTEPNGQQTVDEENELNELRILSTSLFDALLDRYAFLSLADATTTDNNVSPEPFGPIPWVQVQLPTKALTSAIRKVKTNLIRKRRKKLVTKKMLTRLLRTLSLLSSTPKWNFL